MNKIKLGDVLDFKRGMSVAGEFYSNEGRYVRLTLGNFTYPECGFKFNTSKEDLYYTGTIRKEFIMKKGDIITPLTEQVRGLLGNTATIPEDGLYIQTQDVAKVIPNETKIDKRFAYYLVSSPTVKKQLDAGSQQTKIRHTSPDKLKDCYAYLPELNTQNKIAKLLDSIKDKIETNNKINAELESMAKTLYDYSFLQFEFPNSEGKPYKSSGGKMVWNEELKREIPEGWCVNNLKDITTLSLGGTPTRDKKEYWGNGKFNWLNSGEVSNFPIITSEEKITRLGLENSATEYMKKGTVIISITGNIRASILGIDSCANQSVVGISESGIYKKEYLYPAISMLLNQFTKISTGNCQQHINKKILEESKTLTPPDTILQNYYLKVEPIYNAILNNAFQNQELSSLRVFLLPLLMNGQVTFKGKSYERQ
ncbi:MAG: restriction endonuclease subunit S [Bacteroidaceae bacterium]|nr:restriction endonuclease subunit S [Bacteroidaceae bacterium]